MLILLFVWLSIGIGLTWLVSRPQGRSAGLPLAYFLGLSLIHVPGALLYADGDELNSTVVTRLGFEQTIIGMAAFLGGVIIARYAFASERWARNGGRTFTYQWFPAIDRLAFLYLCAGCVFYFGVLPFARNIPSATSIVSAIGSLIIVGACLRLWVANESRNRRRFFFGMAMLPLLPLATLIQGGFLGYGTYWALAILAFLFAQSKSKIAYILLAPVVCFVGLSVFVNYMAARNEIRQLVWDEQVGIGDRVQRVANIFQNFELLDLSNWRHREVIDARLNQNALVGAAVARLESGHVEYASGATFGNMIVVLIPRALWPDKPAIGGGGTVVHDFTGIEFAEGTSVGAGQIFEFYVNFGVLGVVGGFLLYGWLLGWMDLRIVECLYGGDQRRFVFWLLISLSLLQPGGNLLEVVASATTSAIAACGLGYLIHRHQIVRKIVGLPRFTNLL
jgi:hypothetical protein